MIAPDSNRSATARSITTRSPLTVEEVEFGDGDVGFATDGTPVDCVRFAELGPARRPARPDRLRDQPRRQPRRRHHLLGHGRRGASRGSSSASRRSPSPSSPRAAAWATSAAASTSASPPPSRPSWSRRLTGEPMPEATLINVNCPAGEPKGIEVTKLGKRIYNDELKLVGEDDGRPPPLRDLRLEAGLRGDRGHRPLRGRQRADLGHADPLRPHRPRRPRDACGAGASRRCWRRALRPA